MFSDFLKEATRMQQGGEPFAIATVVRREHPTSGKPGDRAIIKKDGSISGWVGGGCTRGIILKEALASMQDGKPRLVAISSTPIHDKKPGVMTYDMTCQGKGSVDVYVEPVLPKPHIVILGKSHIAMALNRLSSAMGYQVTVAADNTDVSGFPEANVISTLADLQNEDLSEVSCIVVSTQGDGDEPALKKALQSDAGYISFVSSRIKANAVFNTLRAMGVTTDQLKRIKTPAGLDINAKLPEEVAVSILAEIIAHLRAEAEESIETSDEKEAVPTPEGFYLNPVCNLPIEKSTAMHVVDYNGEKVYFCCNMCKVQFDKEPEKYMEHT